MFTQSLRYIQSLIGRLLSYLIMPAQLEPFSPPPTEEDARIIDDMKQQVEITDLKLPSSNNAIIDARQYKNPANMDEDRPEYIILHAVANSTYYESYEYSYALEARYYNRTVIGFNFRNVQHSSGIAYSEKDWIDDALTMINFCVEQGYSPRVYFS